jgi:hypothetical protein
MARTRNAQNGRLEEALAILIQNQAAFVAQLRETDREQIELQRKIDERFLRIETLLLEHSRILAEHTRILQRLPEEVREKISFKSQ